MRPTEYDDELARHIAFTLAVSRTRLEGLCNLNDHWPTKDTIVQWMHENKEFAELMADSVMIRDEIIGDEIIDLASDESKPIEEVEAEIKRLKSLVDAAG